MEFIISTVTSAASLFVDSAPYVILGLVISGMLRVFLNPARVAEHLGKGRFLPVFKAAFLGVPLPLCSCGVLPAAVALKKQGANNGAVTAFMISTPESGVDSIAVSWALLDPIMAVVRPVAAFVAAALAGVTENLFSPREAQAALPPDLTCPVDACCSGRDCPPEVHAAHHGLGEKLRAGVRFAFGEVWGDMAGWFFAGLLIAGFVMAVLPPDLLGRHLGGGILSMIIMLGAGIPIYICATASTPIAAALILQGVSPGAALVFLLAGPATNVTSLTVLFGTLGKRAAGIYLASIAVTAVLAGLAVDHLYAALGLQAAALAGQAAEAVPLWAGIACAVLLGVLSVKPVVSSLARRFTRNTRRMESAPSCTGESCGCSHSHSGLMEHTHNILK